MTIAVPAPAETIPARQHRLSCRCWACSAALCVLILLPMSWLVYLRLIDKRPLTLHNFVTLFSDPTFIDPLVTTAIIAVSSAIVCCLVAAPDELARLAHRHAAAAHRPRARHRLLRDAAISWRHCLGVSGRAELRAAQSAVSGAPRRRNRTSISSTSIRCRASSSSSPATPFRTSSCCSPTRLTASRATWRMLPRSSAAAPGPRRDASPSRSHCRRCSRARWSLSSKP